MRMIFGKHTPARLWLYLILLALASALPAFAQDNEFQITNSLYEIYVQANKVRYEPEVLAIADSMYDEAVKLDDKKAQCIARTISVNYYISTGEEDLFRQAIADCQALARQNNYLQYYYFASSAEIRWFLARNKLLHAMQLAKTMLSQALEDNNDYGILQSYRMQGHIYILRQCPDLAIEQYTKALDYMLNYQPDQDPASLYVQLAECYIRKGEASYPAARENLERGLQAAKTHSSRTQVLTTQCRLAYMTGNTHEFNTLYKECVRIMSDKGMMHRGKMQELDIYYYSYSHPLASSFAYIDSVYAGYNRYKTKENIALNMGEYRNAYEASVAKNLYRDSVIQTMLSSDIEEINAEMNLMRIEEQNKQLIYARRFTYVILLILLIAIAVLVLLFYNKQKYNRKLHNQNKELVKARDMAESANKMKDAFIHNMSHEIRTPLNAIVGISQIITMPDMELAVEEKEEYKNIICHNAELLTTLVNDILDLAALENGKYSISKKVFHCNELCQLTIASVKNRCMPGVNLYFSTELSDDFQIVSDEKRIRQVLINFLSNALKHTEQGEICLHASLTGDARQVVFSVTDTGPGIPAEKIPILFDRFVKLNTTKPGTGLGLNICRVIADLLGGEVSLDPTYTGGSRFLFTLPLTDSAD